MRHLRAAQRVCQVLCAVAWRCFLALLTTAAPNALEFANQVTIHVPCQHDGAGYRVDLRAEMASKHSVSLVKFVEKKYLRNLRHICEERYIVPETSNRMIETNIKVI